MENCFQVIFWYIWITISIGAFEVKSACLEEEWLVLHLFPTNLLNERKATAYVQIFI